MHNPPWKSKWTALDMKVTKNVKAGCPKQSSFFFSFSKVLLKQQKALVSEEGEMDYEGLHYPSVTWLL